MHHTIFFLIISTLFIILLLFFFIFHCKKKKLIRKICHLSMHDKCRFLNELTEPLGYQYNVMQDIFTSTTDAWQKYYGYGDIYDKLAPYSGMIIDSLPVYFDYKGKTWLIEFWKGQYGINTGSELGVYHADGIVPPEKRKTTMFAAVPEYEYLDMRTELLHNGCPVANVCAAHWWLTIFSMGHFSHPCDLKLNISIRFPDPEMRDAFLDSLLQEDDFEPESLLVCFNTVIFTFETCCHKRSWLDCFVLWKCRFFCWLYRFVTRPFTCTCDKLLYLYFYLPFAFRHMLRLKRFRKQKHRRKEYRDGVPPAIG